jgi:hypothetical protein
MSKKLLEALSMCVTPLNIFYSRIEAQKRFEHINLVAETAIKEFKEQQPKGIRE